MVHTLGKIVQVFDRWRWDHDEQRGDDSKHLI